MAERLYSINFTHDSEQWTATVGRTLAGRRYRRLKRRGVMTEVEDRLSDPATVLAIFEGYPYKVVTDHGIPHSVGSEWVNPFMVDEPTSFERFTL
jgi:hypothetical protein